ncbi:DNA alkylation repair protein [Aureispira anguillae]|uniref:DNA alkylation repair protein n=1 Tax=Aureispira anguillae TaxID=2864201 RepID=A0A915YGA3_9BACT|nr:DNA alkylation repair protein [Aureispira anguillae]BDS12502.1 DNA alkylation repair protein [Aureispira anguillae]
MDYIDTLELELIRNANAKVAQQQKAYMRGQFDYYGIKATQRKELQKPFLIKAFLPDKSELERMVKILWKKPQREFQYFAQELAFRYVKQPALEDIQLYEFMVKHKSWWDTVDFIANKLMGAYFKHYPAQREPYVNKWLASNNIWLQRSALLFQLKYKKDLDRALLSATIHPLLGSNEFFINKAIGWVLREYSRVNPEWVIEFSNKTTLSPLSKKEALRLIPQGNL